MYTLMSHYHLQCSPCFTDCMAACRLLNSRSYSPLSDPAMELGQSAVELQLKLNLTRAKTRERERNKNDPQ